MARFQDGGIQDLGSCGELGLTNAFRATAVETDERHLDRNVIGLTGNTDEKRTEARTHKSNLEVVQEGGNVVPPPQESVNNGPSLAKSMILSFYYSRP